MASDASDQTRLLPENRRRPSSARDGTTGIPTDLLIQSTTRLRALALLYAFTFFMAGFFPPLLFQEDRTRLLSDPTQWAPGAIAISVALVVAEVIRRKLVPPAAALTVGLAFEVAGSYGIAAAEFLEPTVIDMNARWLGLSWVAVWTLLFTIVVPTAPRRALLAAFASVSSVPVVLGLAMAFHDPVIAPNVVQFFFRFIFPYLLVVLMAYGGARVIYALGAEVTRARQLGSYQLVERLGQGGMGEVWHAKHRLLARPAAIKLIRPSLVMAVRAGATSDLQVRFEREAQALASLRSPHTVNLFDFGLAADGAFYYVMELLEGVDCNSLVKRFGPVPFERVIHILQQVCHSLSEAESRGLVHRDIKPANIFLCRYGEEVDFVKVLDFGLVKAFNDEAKSPGVTLEQAVQGTPAFMAPEQALGQSDLDSRVDIYATGCVAYWLLTGQLVFSGDTTVALLVHHAHTPPTAPSLRCELPIPAALDELVLACLAKNPAERPSSVGDLSRRLAAIPCAATWTSAQAHGWWTTHRPEHRANRTRSEPESSLTSVRE